MQFKSTFVFADHTLRDLIPDTDVESELMESFIPRITPGDVLAYTTGASQEPAAGFSIRPKIRFVPCDEGAGVAIPTASTCTNTMTLFVNEVSQTDKFHVLMVKALMNGNFFSAL